MPTRAHFNLHVKCAANAHTGNPPAPVHPSTHVPPLTPGMTGPSAEHSHPPTRYYLRDCTCMICTCMKPTRVRIRLNLPKPSETRNGCSYKVLVNITRSKIRCAPSPPARDRLLAPACVLSSPAPTHQCSRSACAPPSPRPRFVASPRPRIAAPSPHFPPTPGACRPRRLPCPAAGAYTRPLLSST